MKGLRRYYKVVNSGMDEFVILCKSGCFGGWETIPTIYYGNAMTAKRAWELYKRERRERGVYDIKGRKIA
jgi:hypothetical protein